MSAGFGGVSCKGTSTHARELSCALSQNCKPVLFTGCGYSGTGLLSHAFRAVNISIGHESLYNNDEGTSDWRRAVFSNASKDFKRVFCQYRHPYKVMFSARATLWNFRINVGDIFGLSNRSFDVATALNTVHKRYWRHLSRDFKALLWWVVYTRAARRQCSCSWNLELVSTTILTDVCLLAGFHANRCAKFMTTRLARVNQHRNGFNDTSVPVARNCVEHIVWFEATSLANQLGYKHFPLKTSIKGSCFHQYKVQFFRRGTKLSGGFVRKVSLGGT